MSYLQGAAGRLLLGRQGEPCRRLRVNAASHGGCRTNHSRWDGALQYVEYGREMGRGLQMKPISILVSHRTLADTLCATPTMESISLSTLHAGIADCVRFAGAPDFPEVRRAGLPGDQAASHSRSALTASTPRDYACDGARDERDTDQKGHRRRNSTFAVTSRRIRWCRVYGFGGWP
jgi:hypothetical protein